MAVFQRFHPLCWVSKTSLKYLDASQQIAAHGPQDGRPDALVRQCFELSVILGDLVHQIRTQGSGSSFKILGDEAGSAAVIWQVLAHVRLGFDGPQQVQAILIWHWPNVGLESCIRWGVDPTPEGPLDVRCHARSFGPRSRARSSNKVTHALPVVLKG